jgi:acyl carrier protein
MMRFVSNDYDNVSAREKGLTLLSKVLYVNKFSDEELFKRTNPNWESLKHLQIILELEDLLGIEINDQEAEELSDIDLISALILRKK